MPSGAGVLISNLWDFLSWTLPKYWMISGPSWHRVASGWTTWNDFKCSTIRANSLKSYAAQTNSAIRKLFTELKIPRPEKGSLTFPAPPLLFHKIEPIQSKPLREMASNELLESKPYESRRLTLSGADLQLITDGLTFSDEERIIAAFLTKELTDLEQSELGDLRQRTALRRQRSCV